MLTVDASASQFQNLGADWLKWRQIKFLGAVKTLVSRGGFAGLHPISSDYLATAFHQQVIARDVVGILIAESKIRSFEALFQLQVENKKSECLCRADILGTRR